MSKTTSALTTACHILYWVVHSVVGCSSAFSLSGSIFLNSILSNEDVNSSTLLRTIASIPAKSPNKSSLPRSCNESFSGYKYFDFIINLYNLNKHLNPINPTNNVNTSFKYTVQIMKPIYERRKLIFPLYIPHQSH